MNESKRRNRRLVWGVGGVVILFGSIALASLCALTGFGWSSLFDNLADFGGEGGLTQVDILPDRFMLYMHYQDFQRAHGLLSSEGQEQYSWSDLRNLYRQQQPIFDGYMGLEQVRLNSTTTADAYTATPESIDDIWDAVGYDLGMRVYYGAQTTATLDIVISPEDGVWKIDALTLTP